MPTSPSQSAADDIVLGLLASQHGAVSRTQLLAAGLAPSRIRSSQRAGRLVRQLPGVYVRSRLVGTLLTDLSAALLWAGADAVIGGPTAGHRWGLEGCDSPSPIHLFTTVSRHAPDGVVLHRSKRISAADKAILDELPFTTSARTIVDLAADFTQAELKALVDDAIYRRIVDASRLVSAADRAAARSVRGPAAVAKLASAWVGQPLESVAEADLDRWLRRCRLPQGVAQYEVSVGFRRYRLDRAWPQQKVGVEIDGLRFHSSEGDIAADHLRDNRLAATGWIVLRTTPREIRRGAPELREALRTHLRARSQAPG